MTTSTARSVCSCPEEKIASPDSRLPQTHAGKILPAMLAVLIPKCPLCLLTYSGAVGVCGTVNYAQGFPLWSIALAAVLLILMFVVLQLNFKGAKTLWAQFLLAVGGSTLLSYMMFDLPEAAFYVAVGLVLFAAWLNASFLHFYFALTNKS